MYHKLKKCLNSRSSHQSCSIEKSVLKNFAIFTWKDLCWNLLIDVRASRPATFFTRDSNTAVVNIAKFLRTLILMKICGQLLLQFLLLTVNISSWVLVSALNSIGLLQRSSLRFKEFSLGCLVVGSSPMWKKEKLAEMVTRCHSLSLVVYHSLSFVVTLCHSMSLVVIRCHSLYHSLPLVVPLVFYRYHSLWLVIALVVTRCTTRLSFYKRSRRSVIEIHITQCLFLNNNSYR